MFISVQKNSEIHAYERVFKKFTKMCTTKTCAWISKVFCNKKFNSIFWLTFWGIRLLSCLKTLHGCQCSLDMNICYLCSALIRISHVVLSRIYPFPDYCHITFYLICQFNNCILLFEYEFFWIERVFIFTSWIYYFGAKKALLLVVWKGSWYGTNEHLYCTA